MAKKPKEVAADVEKTSVVTRIRIGIVVKTFMHCRPYGPQHGVRDIKAWPAGQIVWNEEILDELLEAGALIEVYYQDVDRPTKD